MSAVAPDFDQAAAYERFMGRWSRAVAQPFLDWLAPPGGARWLDVGCGSGILAAQVLERCSPSEVFGVDPAAQQIAQASRGPAGSRAWFEVGDARALGFPDRSFDVVASALVLNFIPERAQAAAEMRRVARPGGLVAAYVWDFADEASPSGPLRRALRELADVPDIPGTRESTLAALAALFQQAGMQAVETRTIEVSLAYADFDDFWSAQTTAYSPTTKIIDALPDKKRDKLIAALPKGRIEYVARANAVKARPGARPSPGTAARK